VRAATSAKSSSGIGWLNRNDSTENRGSVGFFEIEGSDRGWGSVAFRNIGAA
jgi:hypothetical protein